MRGRFITIEGGEGVGKSTQLVRLAEGVRQRGHQVVETREPGGSPGAEAIRSLLLQGGEERWTTETEALLFAAARADHVARRIRPALAAGDWVICDRFIDSSIAYQGGGGGVGEDAIRRLHAVGSGDLYPDRTLILQLPGRVGAGRAAFRDQGNADRIGGRDSKYHDNVEQTFADLAAREPNRFRVIDAEGPPEAVTQRLLDALEDLL